MVISINKQNNKTMEVYHEINKTMRYIKIQDSDKGNKVLGLTVNRMLIVVDKSNKRIDEYECPFGIWDLFQHQIRIARMTPEHELRLYFGEQDIQNDDAL